MSGMNIKHRSSVKRAVLFFGLLVLLAGCGKETDFSLDAGASGGSDETGPEETPKSRAVLIEVQKDCKRAQIYAGPLLSNE